MNIIIYLVPDHKAIKKFQLFDDSDTGVLQPTLRKIPKFQAQFPTETLRKPFLHKISIPGN